MKGAKNHKRNPKSYLIAKIIEQNKKKLTGNVCGENLV